MTIRNTISYLAGQRPNQRFLRRKGAELELRSWLVACRRFLKVLLTTKPDLGGKLQRGTSLLFPLPSQTGQEVQPHLATRELTGNICFNKFLLIHKLDQSEFYSTISCSCPQTLTRLRSLPKLVVQSSATSCWSALFLHVTNEQTRSGSQSTQTFVVLNFGLFLFLKTACVKKNKQQQNTLQNQIKHMFEI